MCWISVGEEKELLGAVEYARRLEVLEEREETEGRRKGGWWLF